MAKSQKKTKPTRRTDKVRVTEILDYYAALDRVSVLLNIHGRAIDEALKFRSIRADRKAQDLWVDAQVKLAELYQYLGKKWDDAEHAD